MRASTRLRAHRPPTRSWLLRSGLALVLCGTPTACIVVLEQAGWVHVLVRDQLGAPVRGVMVCFDVQNSSDGHFSTCEGTGSDGTAIEAVEQGERRVWLDADYPLPAGYALGAGATERRVTVVENDTTRVSFVITKQTP